MKTKQPINVRGIWPEYCHEKGIAYDHSASCDMVRPYDDTTLFCPSGMQQYKGWFTRSNLFTGITQANIQSCIRMNDFEEIGDDSHLLYFNMIGLFSFRDKSVEWAIDFWMEFLTRKLNLVIGHVTIHSACREWIEFYEKWEVPVIEDDENCTWSDGNIGGYCTEFFIDGIEIGNIVNPLGTCIDVGFGLERLEMMVNGVKNKTKQEALVETIVKIIESGYKPSGKLQGYVLRKLIRELYVCGGNLDRTLYKSFFTDEIDRQNKLVEKYHRLKERFSHMPKEWWYDTHGINLDDYVN